jgi:ABC-type uncharacterized transport system fused permease/ATPase subunit
LGRFAQARLKLEWRRFLTQQMLQAYFSRRAFFKLKLQAASIDNPDQVGRPFCSGTHGHRGAGTA